MRGGAGTELIGALVAGCREDGAAAAAELAAFA